MAVSIYLLIVVLIQCVISTIGFTLNSFFVRVVIKNRQLRSTSCGLLLVVLAFWDCTTEFSLIFLPTVLHLTDNTISLFTCFCAEIITPFADMNGYLMIFLISLDRLIGTLSPIRYKWLSTEHKEKEVTFLALIAALLCIYMPTRFYGDMMKMPKKQVYCLPSDFMVDDNLALNNNITMALFALTFCNYVAIWLMFRRKAIRNAQSSADKRIFKSLLVLMGVIIFCWLPAPVLQAYLFPYLSMSDNMEYFVYRLLVLLKKVATAMNVPVLYLNSSDYRLAMQKELPCIFKNVSLANNQTNIGQRSSNANPNAKGASTKGASTKQHHQQQQQQTHYQQQQQQQMRTNSLPVVNNFVRTTMY